MSGRPTTAIAAALMVVLLGPGSHLPPTAEPAQARLVARAELRLGPLQRETWSGGVKLHIEGFGRWFEPARGTLPSRIVTVAIPPGATYERVGWTIVQQRAIPEAGDSKPRDVVPVEYVRTSGYRAYNLVELRVTPFQFDRTARRWVYCPGVDIEVAYRAAAPTPRPARETSPRIRATVEALVLNHRQADLWYSDPPSSAGRERGDFVIITTDALRQTVAPLEAWERTKGRHPKVVTVSWIDTNIPGDDRAQRIRTFLRDRCPADRWGIEDVLIVGHWRDVPLRRLDDVAGDGGQRLETDFYYAELSRPDRQGWDSNGNGTFGEQEDAFDMLAEVNVGRIPWSDPETVARISSKSIAFERSQNATFKHSILLLASFIDQATDGAAFQEYVVDARRHPWMSTWRATRLYEERSAYRKDGQLSHANVVSAWSGGKYAVVSWHAHGSPDGSMTREGKFISVEDTPQLNDAFPAIVSGASCSNADTRQLSIGQALMKQGAVGFLGANRSTAYGSRWRHPNDGSDQAFKYFFLAEVTSGRRTQGAAHQFALREMYLRGLWNKAPQYEGLVQSTLFGNPNLSLRVVVPGTAGITGR